LLCKANQSNTEWNDPITTGKWQDSEEVGYKTKISRLKSSNAKDYNEIYRINDYSLELNSD
jgi:hypothetical protein